MNRRGEVEIVINARWIERAVFLLLIVALAVFSVWQYTAKSATSDAQLQARVATLETSVADKDAQIANLTAQITALKSPPTPTPVVPATPPVTPPVTAPVTPPVSGGTLSLTWNHDGNYPSSGKYKLTDVSVVVHNGVDRSATFDYSLCWSSIECKYTVQTGSFSVGAGSDFTFHVPLSIPTLVSTGNTLSLAITSGGKTVLDEDKIVN